MSELNLEEIKQQQLLAVGIPESEWLLRSCTEQSLLSEDIPALVAEVERLRAELDSQNELVRRAVRGLTNIGEIHYPDEPCDPHPLDCSLAGRVSRVFCIGSTRAIELCRKHGQDPDWIRPVESEYDE